MKIAIDISQVVYNTGVSRYTKNILKNLLRVGPKNEYILFGGSLRRSNDLKNFTKELKGRFQTRFFPIPPTLADILGNIVHFPNIEFLIGEIDVFHSSDWSQPPSSAFKVTTIHDLAPLLLPEFTPKRVVSVHTRRLDWVKREADRIIVPTNATENDLINLGFDQRKIRVIYEGVDPIFKARTEFEVQSLKRKLGVKTNYLLGIGVNRRKNTDRIIQAFKKLKDEQGLRLWRKDLKLVLVGHKYEDIKSDEGIIFAGHVKDEDMPVLYSGASALVYPSLYEGFGLPILEAFACNCPVVTSNISSMAEVAKNAAVLVNPQSVDSIAEGIEKAVLARSVLTHRGLERVKEFSWEKAGRETLKIYEEFKA
ncbi:hypothetical protein A2125_00285 [Candidatus Woesebacteria bacterium GWB1_43_5]|uniref:Glycosyl transferase family 1 domain-containing protein n=1 Tax=Candidatus Woesebacteria bacterium GWB1_43_5 TaxID=1802474 RepID=A0A1F7WRT8_9BACT|nr:MAG: hypothetical protein A2125_00285 [Candidatus Woesebacteria bacterium GWB1_43_5]